MVAAFLLKRNLVHKKIFKSIKTNTQLSLPNERREMAEKWKYKWKTTKRQRGKNILKHISKKI